MSSHYNTEPPPTASATLHTTAGPIHISLFAQQAPLACKNFLQHCLDGYYTGTIFHRITPGFVIQGGDPTGTGSGGSSIYEDDEEKFGIDPKTGEKVIFGDELHSRLKFNRRGLVGMAKSEVGGTKRRGGGVGANGESPYGSQFFVTLANTERELNGTCTLFGRLEGDSIYNVVKIAESELVEGTERPVYAIRVTGCEVGDLGPFTGVLKKREKVAKKEGGDDGEAARKKQERKLKKKKDAKSGKALLSFGADEGEEDTGLVGSGKPKFNTKLVTAGASEPTQDTKREKNTPSMKATRSRSPVPSKPQKRPRSPSPASHSPPVIRRKPQVPDPHTQLPLPDEEIPPRSRSPSSSVDEAPRQTALSRTNAEIASLKASMRRDTAPTTTETTKKKSALEAMIPKTSIRGRKRPPPGGSAPNGSAFTGNSDSRDNEALKMFNAFKARLEGANTGSDQRIPSSSKRGPGKKDSSNGDSARSKPGRGGEDEKEDEEAQLCDLHFIANCQSCRSWDNPNTADSSDDKNGKGTAPSSAPHGNDDDDDPRDWMTHVLSFGKDTLGKDLSWKREHADDADGLVVIDPREKGKEIVGSKSRKKERELKEGRGGEREWDRERDQKGKRREV
ncbi:Peptidyl-prolyl isomerase cwc27 [Arachnomyces sp. PD_36]|nr:Peptidyl-prolyl isomerase cwc27 [Arachnomyces sp. PD_36]